MLSVIKLRFIYCYAGCRYAECRGALQSSLKARYYKTFCYLNSCRWKWKKESSIKNTLFSIWNN
jgi:hypothetical protein